jgi:hypothetical protein
VQLTRGVLDASLMVLGVTAETRDDITLALSRRFAAAFGLSFRSVRLGATPRPAMWGLRPHIAL